MQIDPTLEWQRLAEDYRARSDEELRELNWDFADLTEVAQQVLSAELRSRGLDKKIAEEQRLASSPSQSSIWRTPSAFADRDEKMPQSRVLGSSASDLVPDSEDDQNGGIADGGAVEYSWKTQLCECEEREHAYQIREVLKRANVESWIEPSSTGLLYTRVLVAADELDRARAIIANPIPQDIVDESHQTVPEYEPPRCPACGAEDPILESVEPVNAWICENCGNEWTEPVSNSQ